MPDLPDLLVLSSDLPEVELAAGDVLVTEGADAGSLWILVSGALDVVKGGTKVNEVTHPGAVIGEVSVLLGTAPGASVVARKPCRLRWAEDGAAFLQRDPAVAMVLARGLAQRLNAVTTYLADLQRQYGDSPGLAMVPDVLRQLASADRPSARPGSARDPDPMY